MKARIEKITSDTKQKSVPFEINGVTYDLVITLNVVEEIQRLKGDFSNALTEAIDNISFLKEFYLLIFNEAIETWNEDHPEEQRQLFTSKSLGRRLTVIDVSELQAMLFTLIGQSLPEPEETKGGDVTDELLAALDAEDLPEDIEKNG